MDSEMEEKLIEIIVKMIESREEIYFRIHQVVVVVRYMDCENGVKRIWIGLGLQNIIMLMDYIWFKHFSIIGKGIIGS